MVLEQFVAFCFSWLMMSVLGLYTAPFHCQCDAIRGSELLVSLAVLLTWDTIYLSPGFHSCQYQPTSLSISQSNLGFVYLVQVRYPSCLGSSGSNTTSMEHSEYYIVGEIAECLTHVPGVCLQVQKRPMFYVQSIKSWSGSSRKRPMHVRSLTLCLWKDDT